jgi:4-hydroxybenzoate polyprenyltransferase
MPLRLANATMCKTLLLYALESSRPRFWLYLAGTYLVGFAFGARSLRDFYSPVFLITFVYFLFPANFLVYAINDYFDRAGDVFNIKKKRHERIFEDKHKVAFFSLLAVSFVLTCIVMLIQSHAISRLWIALFVVLGVFYSAPPIRFKTKAILDFSSNVLYVMPGLAGYSAISGMIPGANAFLCAFLWTWAMHLFSAIPDIIPDKNAKFFTTAVCFGKKNSLILVFLFWLGFWLMTMSLPIWPILQFAAILYPIIPLYLLATPEADISRIYWLFPIINGLGGMIVFWSAFIRLL